MEKFNSAVYLSGLNVDVMRFGLKAATEILARFGNPQNRFKTVLVGGTNGKGSTAVMLASILKAAGYRVGLYTSPHLVDVRERIVFDGRKIPLREFNRILSEIEKQTLTPLTYFEVLTAAALIYFQRARVDIAVMEVGLGGRLDATNVCRPLASVITNIGLEHTRYLGNTLEAIAGEKAGIIKRYGVCVTAATQPKVIRKLAGICRERKAAFYRIGKDFGMIEHVNGSVDYRGIHKSVAGLKIPLPGGHQRQNAALALAALEIIEHSGLNIDESAVRRGLKAARFAARMETLCTRPLFLLDGAHNPSGIAVLRRALQKDFSWRRLILIFAALADKDCRGMLQKIAPLAHVTILPPLKTGRSVPAEKMARIMDELQFPSIIVESVDEAIRRAFELAHDRDVICAAGSLYLAGEVKQSFHQKRSCGKA